MVGPRHSKRLPHLSIRTPYIIAKMDQALYELENRVLPHLEDVNLENPEAQHCLEEVRTLLGRAYGLTTPLITLATGAKMGKTENGAVWLDEKFLSPYDYWQFWRNTDDRDVIKFLNIFTDLTIEEIENIKNNDINELKVLLANKTTEMLHGESEAQNSEKIARETFSENSTGSNLPSVKIKKDLLNADFSILDLVVLSKLENSKSEVRRLIKSNGVRINNEIVTDEKKIISTELFHDNFIKLSLGKKRHIKIELN
jgi:tyrosyl-tRNA synthetase